MIGQVWSLENATFLTSFRKIRVTQFCLSFAVNLMWHIFVSHSIIKCVELCRTNCLPATELHEFEKKTNDVILIKGWRWKEDARDYVIAKEGPILDHEPLQFSRYPETDHPASTTRIHLLHTRLVYSPRRLHLAVFFRLKKNKKQWKQKCPSDMLAS